MTERAEVPAFPVLDEPKERESGRSPAAQLPEPARFWIRYVPRPRPLERYWPTPPGPWLDLSRGRLFGLEPADAVPSPAGVLPVPDLSPDPLDDVLYLPPVDGVRAEARNALATRHAAHGTPVLVQVSVDDATSCPSSRGIHQVVDLTPALLARRLEALERIPPGSTAAWPVVAGVTDDPELFEAACARLAAAGAEAVQGVVPDLTPADKRRLMERFGEDLFDALFHRDPPQVRSLARVAHAHGLEPFMERPIPQRPMLGIGNRSLAGWIALAAELQDRLGRPPQPTQNLYRAAREADRTPYDLEALARDGNLDVLDWLSPEIRDIVDDALEGKTPRRVRQLLEEYVA